MDNGMMPNGYDNINDFGNEVSTFGEALENAVSGSYEYFSGVLNAMSSSNAELGKQEQEVQRVVRLLRTGGQDVQKTLSEMKERIDNIANGMTDITNQRQLVDDARTQLLHYFSENAGIKMKDFSPSDLGRRAVLGSSKTGLGDIVRSYQAVLDDLQHEAASNTKAIDSAKKIRGQIEKLVKSDTLSRQGFGADELNNLLFDYEKEYSNAAKIRQKSETEIAQRIKDTVQASSKQDDSFYKKLKRETSGREAHNEGSGFTQYLENEIALAEKNGAKDLQTLKDYQKSVNGQYAKTRQLGNSLEAVTSKARSQSSYLEAIEKKLSDYGYKVSYEKSKGGIGFVGRVYRPQDVSSGRVSIENAPSFKVDADVRGTVGTHKNVPTASLDDRGRVVVETLAEKSLHGVLDILSRKTSAKALERGDYGYINWATKTSQREASQFAASTQGNRTAKQEQEQHMRASGSHIENLAGIQNLQIGDLITGIIGRAKIDAKDVFDIRGQIYDVINTLLSAGTQKEFDAYKEYFARSDIFKPLIEKAGKSIFESSQQLFEKGLRATPGVANENRRTNENIGLAGGRNLVPGDQLLSNIQRQQGLGHGLMLDRSRYATNRIAMKSGKAQGAVYGEAGGWDSTVPVLFMQEFLNQGNTQISKVLKSHGLPGASLQDSIIITEDLAKNLATEQRTFKKDMTSEEFGESLSRALTKRREGGDAAFKDILSTKDLIGKNDLRQILMQDVLSSVMSEELGDDIKDLKYGSLGEILDNGKFRLSAQYSQKVGIGSKLTDAFGNIRGTISAIVARDVMSDITKEVTGKEQPNVEALFGIKELDPRSVGGRFGSLFSGIVNHSGKSLETILQDVGSMADGSGTPISYGAKALKSIMSIQNGMLELGDMQDAFAAFDKFIEEDDAANAELGAPGSGVSKGRNSATVSMMAALHKLSAKYGMGSVFDGTAGPGGQYYIGGANLSHPAREYDYGEYGNAVRMNSGLMSLKRALGISMASGSLGAQGAKDLYKYFSEERFVGGDDKRYKAAQQQAEQALARTKESASRPMTAEDAEHEITAGWGDQYDIDLNAVQSDYIDGIKNDFENTFRGKVAAARKAREGRGLASNVPIRMVSNLPEGEMFGGRVAYGEGAGARSYDFSGRDVFLPASFGTDAFGDYYNQAISSLIANQRGLQNYVKDYGSAIQDNEDLAKGFEKISDQAKESALSLTAKIQDDVYNKEGGEWLKRYGVRTSNSALQKIIPSDISQILNKSDFEAAAQEAMSGSADGLIKAFSSDFASAGLGISTKFAQNMLKGLSESELATEYNRIFGADSAVGKSIEDQVNGIVDAMTIGTDANNLYLQRMAQSGNGFDVNRIRGFDTIVGRSPYTNGLDLKANTLTFINRALDNTDTDAFSIGAALARQINADFDGDRIGVAFNTGMEEGLHDLFGNLGLDQRKIQRTMAQWMQADFAEHKNETLFSEGDMSYDMPTVYDKAADTFAALAGTFAKTKVGFFSNENKMARGLMADAGVDETSFSGNLTGDKAVELAQSMLVRATMESVEQDSISAKKLINRIMDKRRESNEKAGVETTAYDEILAGQQAYEEIYWLADKMRQGGFQNIEEFTGQLTNMGLLDKESGLKGRVAEQIAATLRELAINDQTGGVAEALKGIFGGDITQMESFKGFSQDTLNSAFKAVGERIQAAYTLYPGMAWRFGNQSDKIDAGAKFLNTLKDKKGISDENISVESNPIYRMGDLDRAGGQQVPTTGTGAQEAATKDWNELAAARDEAGSSLESEIALEKQKIAIFGKESSAIADTTKEWEGLTRAREEAAKPLEKGQGDSSPLGNGQVRASLASTILFPHNGIRSMESYVNAMEEDKRTTADVNKLETTVQNFIKQSGLTKRTEILDAVQQNAAQLLGENFTGNPADFAGSDAAKIVRKTVGGTASHRVSELLARTGVLAGTQFKSLSEVREAAKNNADIEKELAQYQEDMNALSAVLSLTTSTREELNKDIMAPAIARGERGFNLAIGRGEEIIGAELPMQSRGAEYGGMKIHGTSDLLTLRNRGTTEDPNYALVINDYKNHGGKIRQHEIAQVSMYKEMARQLVEAAGAGVTKNAEFDEAVKQWVETGVTDNTAIIPAVERFLKEYVGQDKRWLSGTLAEQNFTPSVEALRGDKIARNVIGGFLRARGVEGRIIQNDGTSSVLWNTGELSNDTAKRLMSFESLSPEQQAMFTANYADSIIDDQSKISARDKMQGYAKRLGVKDSGGKGYLDLLRNVISAEQVLRNDGTADNLKAFEDARKEFNDIVGVSNYYQGIDKGGYLSIFGKIGADANAMLENLDFDPAKGFDVAEAAAFKKDFGTQFSDIIANAENMVAGGAKYEYLAPLIKRLSELRAKQDLNEELTDKEKSDLAALSGRFLDQNGMLLQEFGSVSDADGATLSELSSKSYVSRMNEALLSAGKEDLKSRDQLSKMVYGSRNRLAELRLQEQSAERDAEIAQEEQNLTNLEGYLQTAESNVSGIDTTMFSPEQRKDYDIAKQASDAQATKLGEAFQDEGLKRGLSLLKEQEQIISNILKLKREIASLDGNQTAEAQAQKAVLEQTVTDLEAQQKIIQESLGVYTGKGGELETLSADRQRKFGMAQSLSGAKTTAAQARQDATISADAAREYNKLLKEQLALEDKMAGYKQRSRISRDSREREANQEAYEAYMPLLTTNQERLDAFRSSAQYQNMSEAERNQIESDFAAQRQARLTAAGARNGGKRTLAESLKGSFQSVITRTLEYSSAYMIIGKAKQSIQQLYQNTVKLNDAMTNLRIVTGENTETARNLIGEYSDLAKELGTTTTAVAQSAAEWLRQGYSVAETNDLIKSSTYLAKLGFMDASAATTALTSSMKGFNIAAQDSMSVVDVLTKLDAKYATTAGDIATALSRTAAVAKSAGLDMEKTAAALTTIIDISQIDASSAGNAFKTILSRYGNVKAGAFENLMEDSGDEGEKLNDVERVLNSIGIQIRSSSKDMKAFDTVLDELADKWERLSDVEKNAVASAMAGKPMPVCGTKYTQRTHLIAGKTLEPFTTIIKKLDYDGLKTKGLVDLQRSS